MLFVERGVDGEHILRLAVRSCNWLGLACHAFLMTSNLLSEPHLPIAGL